MGQIIAGISAASASSGYIMYDAPSPGVIGPIINSYTTLQIPAYWRALNFKSANMASFPRSVRRNGVEVPHRLDTLLKRKPNAYQSPTMLWRTWWFHQAHYANGFLEIERDQMFNPIALHNRYPEYVAPFRYLDDEGQVTQWYWVGGHRPHIVSSADMLHLTGQSFDGLSGLNPVWLHSETFERARLLDRYVTKFLVRGSVVRGAIEIPLTVSPDQEAAILATLRKFKGADAEDDTMILSGGAKLNNATLTNDESKLIELHKLSTQQIAQLSDVPPHFLYDDSEGKYNANVQQAGEDVVRYTFRLMIEQSEDELIKLLPDAEQEQGFTVHIDPAALLRGDTVTESNIAIATVNAGLETRNEGRADIGLAPIAGPDNDKLKTLGDSSPPPIVPDPSSPKSAAATTEARTMFDQMKPIIEAACDRIEAKTENAFTRRENKTPEERTIWGNVFAEEQARYIHQELAPIADVLKTSGESLDVEAIASRYSGAIRKRISDGTIRTLREIIMGETSEQDQ